MKKITLLIIILFSLTLLFASEEGWTTITVFGEEMEWDGYRVKESETDLDPYATSFSDIAEDRFFTENYPVEKETYTINKGNFGETEVVHIKSPNPGAVIYIVAGVHGDEKAAWYAGIILKSATIKEGELYILSPANTFGGEKKRRYFYASQDLNRSFPGNPNGDEAERMAYAIYSDIERIRPDFVFDLHEAILYTDSRDFLGSSYIYSDMSLLDDLLIEMVWATEDEELCTTAFGLNGPGPQGSINSSVTKSLRIPVITVETFRGLDIKRRVYDQIDTVQYVLAYYGMV